MSGRPEPPGRTEASAMGSRRLAAIVSLLALAINVTWLLGAALTHWVVLVASIVSMAVLISATWYVVSRRGATRYLAALVGAAALVGFVTVVISRESIWVLMVSLLL